MKRHQAVVRFLGPALGSYGMILAGPDEALRHLDQRPVDLLLLDDAVPAAQRVEVLAAAGRAGVATVLITQSQDADDRPDGVVHCIPLVTGPEDLARLFRSIWQSDSS